MLRITASTSARGVQAYFDNELCQGDYYTKGNVIEGRWHGKTAALLGLEGDVTREAFHALTENRHPGTGEKLTPRMKSGRRVGYDFTFSAKKSVSLLYAATEDPRILAAFRDSVRETMAEMETEMQTRVRRGGRSEDRITGNMVWAEFVHFNARPIDGVSDPHLHCHAYVFNLTRDPSEDRYKAGQFGGLKRDAPYYQAAFDARLGRRLVRLGYGLETRGKSWELSGIAPETLRKFSRRTTEVEREAKEKGITSETAKADLGARTRRNKAEDLGGGYSRQAVLSRMTLAENQALVQLVLAAFSKEEREGSQDQSGAAAGLAVDCALAHGFERQSVLSEKRLKAAALAYGVGAVTPEGIAAEVGNRPEVLRCEKRGETLTTTRGVLAEEKALISFARDGRNVQAPLVPGPQLKNRELGSEQKRAVTQMLTSTDRVIALRGGAGTGKTWLTREAVDQIKATGKPVVMLAPSAAAARGVLRAEGFTRADTVARFLLDPEMQSQAGGGVIWVDEAGLLGAKEMGAIFRAAEQQKSRVVLVGDTRQHASVARGDALRILEDHGGVTPATLTTIRRQKTASYRAVVEDLAQGKTTQGVQKMVAGGQVVARADREDRHAMLAKDYLAAMTAKKSVLAVAPTHREGNAVTAAIRTALKAAGRLDSAEREVACLTPLHLTAAEKGDARRYQAGEVIQFHQNAPGIRRGSRFTVERVDSGGIMVQGGAGGRCALPLHLAARFEVFRAETRKLAIGERIRITKGAILEAAAAAPAPGLRPRGGPVIRAQTKTRTRLNNGDSYSVAGFTKSGGIILGNKKGTVLPADFGHLTHGYVTTSHASQGKTVDRVLIAQSAESWRASSAEQVYVSVSRGRESCRVFTDDVEALQDAVSRSSARPAAVELAQDRQQGRRWEQAVERQRLRGYQARTQALAQLVTAQEPPALKRSRERGIEREPEG